MNRIMKGNRMRNRVTILVLFCLIWISGVIQCQENPVSIYEWKKTFNSVNKGAISKEEMEKRVGRDIVFFTEIIKNNEYRKIGYYYLGLLKWIEENGDEKYLSFLADICKEFNTLPKINIKVGGNLTHYLGNADRIDLYMLASKIWFKIKTKDMREEEKVDLIIESLKKDSGMPKFQGEVWRRYEKQLAAKRDKIYDILLNGEINEDYYKFAFGFTVREIFKLQGLTPTAEEVRAIMKLKDRELLKSNMIEYFLRASDDRYLEIFVPYIMEQYRNAETYEAIRRYDHLLCLYLELDFRTFSA